MKRYEKPVVMINEELAEGVYAASGCWTAGGTGKQTRVSSRDDFRFQINGSHISEAHAAKVIATFTFDLPVNSATFCGYKPIGDISAGATVVQFELTNYSGGVNPDENFGGGALNVVTVDKNVTELTLISVTISDAGVK